MLVRRVNVMIEVRFASLALDPQTNSPVIVLKPLLEEPGHGRLLPIWIGHPEATAILLALEGAEPSRPLTHDLMRNMLQSLDTYVERVEITRVEEGTFFAALVLRGEERSFAIDARPSDSIALAIRMGAPLFVAEEVLESAAIADEPGAMPADEEAELAEFRDFLDSVQPEDFES